jgi:hypothetical protein
VARDRENRTFRFSAWSLVQYSTVQYGHARDRKLVRVGHKTVSKKILVYIEFDIYMQVEETTKRAGIK